MSAGDKSLHDRCEWRIKFGRAPAMRERLEKRLMVGLGPSATKMTQSAAIQTSKGNYTHYPRRTEEPKATSLRERAPQILIETAGEINAQQRE